MYIAIASASIFFLVIYLIFSINLYKKNTGNSFSIRNVFSYEIFYKNGKEQFAVNILLIISLALVFVNNLIYLSFNYDPNRLLICILLFISLVAFGVISIVPLSKLKEHFIFAIICFGATALLGALLIFSDFKYYQIEYRIEFIFSIIFDCLITLSGFIAMLNPRVTRLNMDLDEEGKLIRPKVIDLALSEWIIGLALFLSQISLIIISII